MDELSRSNRIPMITVYKRVSEMFEVGLLTLKKTILTEEWKSLLGRIVSKVSHSDRGQPDIAIDVELNEDLPNYRFPKLWTCLRE